MDKIEPPDPTPKKENSEQGELANLASSKQSKNQPKPRNSAKKTGRTKQKEDKKLPQANIVGPLLGLIGVIVTALLTSPIIKCWLLPYTCEPPPPTPTLTPMPAISISNDVRDKDSNPIAMNSAPFEVKVSGTVSNANGLYVYLIVANKNDDYVQPRGLGPNVDGDFSISGYLGVQNVPDGLTYTIYAVVTDKPYVEFASFKGENFIAKSKKLILTRESLPVSTPTP